jgi:hypothetical protein
MVFWRDMEGILVVVGEFFKMDRKAVVTVEAGLI